MHDPLIIWHEKEKEVEKESIFEIIPVASFQLGSKLEVLMFKFSIFLRDYYDFYDIYD